MTCDVINFYILETRVRCTRILNTMVGLLLMAGSLTCHFLYSGGNKTDGFPRAISCPKLPDVGGKVFLQLCRLSQKISANVSLFSDIDEKGGVMND